MKLNIQGLAMGLDSSEFDYGGLDKNRLDNRELAVNGNLKVNEPHVVHETIDGETILMHLGTGNYYSIEWPGTVIWNMICQMENPAAVREALDKTGSPREKESRESFNSFVDSLLKEKLLVSAGKTDSTLLELDEQTEAELKKAAGSLDKLILNKYTDMKDLLLLDPIHEVDAKGWPKPDKKSGASE